MCVREEGEKECRKGMHQRLKCAQVKPSERLTFLLPAMPCGPSSAPALNPLGCLSACGVDAYCVACPEVFMDTMRFACDGNLLTPRPSAACFPRSSIILILKTC